MSTKQRIYNIYLRKTSLYCIYSKRKRFKMRMNKISRLNYSKYQYTKFSYTTSYREIFWCYVQSNMIRIITPFFTNFLHLTYTHSLMNVLTTHPTRFDMKLQTSCLSLLIDTLLETNMTNERTDSLCKKPERDACWSFARIL